jgi:hypothetical protein
LREVNVLVAVVGGEHDEARIWCLHADALDHVYAAHPRQAQVNQRDIGQVFAKLRDRLNAVRGLADHFKLVSHL